MYTRPSRNLKVLLKAFGIRAKSYTAEFLIENDCFDGEWPWWALFVKVKRLNTFTDHSQVKTTYELQVRTSKCVKMCTETFNMQGLVALSIRASGASEWRYSHPQGRCGHIPPWKTGAYQEPYLTCSSLSSAITACTFPLPVPAGVSGGVSAGAIVIVVVVVAVMAKKLKRYRQTPVQGVAVRP